MVTLTFLYVGLYDEVTEMKKACGAAHLKTILATGELGSLNNVYKASLVCMMAGKCITLCQVCSVMFLCFL